LLIFGVLSRNEIALFGRAETDDLKFLGDPGGRIPISILQTELLPNKIVPIEKNDNNLWFLREILSSPAL
jgi:hypothetical protein